VTQQESIKRILTEKSFQNRDRSQQLELRVKNLVTTAKMFVGGSEIEITTTEPLTRIVKGFQELVRRTYPNLKMLHGINYSENNIENYLRQSTGTLFGDELSSLNEAEQEILAFIQSNNRGGVRSTIKSLAERFERKPYGWSLAAVQCNLALLSAHGKVEMRTEGNLLEEMALVKSLKNTQAHEKVVLEPQVEFTASQVRRLKEFYEDFFDKPPQSNEARDLGKEIGLALDERMNILNQLLSNRFLYPFLLELSEPINHLKEQVGKPYTYYLLELPNHMNDLLNMKEHTIAPILSFWNGPLRALYDEARQYHQTQTPNFDYLEGDDAEQLGVILADPDVFRGSLMQQARGLMETLKKKLAEQLKVEKHRATDAIKAQRDRLIVMSDYGLLSIDEQGQLNHIFETFLAQLGLQTLIAKIRDIRRTFEEEEYPQLLTKMTNWAHPRPVENTSGKAVSGDHVFAEPKVEYISNRSIQVHFEKAWLADEKDIDQYLEALRSALVKEIKNGKRVQI
jgi:hypothetical protein